MTTVSEVVSKPLSQVLVRLTNQDQIDLAISALAKDFIRLRLKEVAEIKQSFELKYFMSFEEFKRQWQAGLIPNAYSYEVEKDYWEWESAVTNETILHELRISFS
jgi:hypothetical protein